MANSVFLLSRDARLIRELDAVLAPRHHLVVGRSIDCARRLLNDMPVQAIVAHVSRRTLNGHAPKEFFDDLLIVAKETPVVALVDEDCCRKLAEQVGQHTAAWWPVSEAVDGVVRWLRANAAAGQQFPAIGETSDHVSDVAHAADSDLTTTAADSDSLCDEFSVSSDEMVYETTCASRCSTKNDRPRSVNGNGRSSNGSKRRRNANNKARQSTSRRHDGPIGRLPGESAVSIVGSQRNASYSTRSAKSNGRKPQPRREPARNNDDMESNVANQHTNGRQPDGMKLPQDQTFRKQAPVSEASQFHLPGTPPSRTLRGRTRSITTFTPAMFGILDEIEVAARYDVTVLLIGETGSGKTFLAHLLHELSDRAEHGFCHVACGALPNDLIESELFGHVKGAFTGADRDREGKFAAAGKGTLLLDEIDVLSPGQQAKLLRVIESGEFEPVGSNETRRCEARLIVASNVDIERLVDEGQFRSDLYFRLNVLKLHLPPLRERPHDLEFLTYQLVETFCQQHRIAPLRIAPEFIQALQSYDWPGNIRELENVVRRAVLYCRNAELTPADLPQNITGIKPCVPTVLLGANDSDRSLERQIDLFERRLIEESLQRNRNRRTATARELGISRVTLYNKMKKFGMLT